MKEPAVTSRLTQMLGWNKTRPPGSLRIDGTSEDLTRDLCPDVRGRVCGLSPSPFSAFFLAVITSSNPVCPFNFLKFKLGHGLIQPSNRFELWSFNFGTKRRR